jgi:hypothetical protein
MFASRMILTAFFLSSMTGGTTWAQEQAPPPDEPAVGVNEFSEPQATYAAPAPGQYQTRSILPRDGYYSPNLRAQFKAQWMYIVQQGRKIEFWGARILSMDHNSPLRELRVNPGDVITRLDGIPIWHNMYRESGRPWQLVQLEQHYGRTEARYILRGSHQVRVGDMMLDGTFDEGAENVVPISP